MTVVIDPITAVIFFVIGFLAGVALAALMSVAALAKRPTL